jgi:hypothetical protein
VIGPPETPSVFMLFFNSQVNEQMSSAFLVFDLIGRNATLEGERTARSFIQPVLGELRAILTGAAQELPKPAEKSFVKEGEILGAGAEARAC